jgi:dephospho-CoA kinase
MKKAIGITGGIGSGKTLIASILIKMGYPVFNSDQEAKMIVMNDREVRQEIIQLFGVNSFLSDGSYNTSYVSEIVFQNPYKLEELNKIIHPRVREKFIHFVNKSESPFVFGESAILFETGAYQNYDKMILVTAPLEIRILRSMQRDNLSREQIEAKISKQWTDEEKLKFNPFVIVNDGKSPLLEQIENIIENLLKDKRELNNREDIEFLVHSFYERILNDEMLAPFFKTLDFDKHLPKMIDFWCFILLGETGYSTNVVEKHIHMPLKAEHFERWLEIFNNTLDANFEGENVEIPKQRAFTIAWTTKSKMKLN